MRRQYQIPLERGHFATLWELGPIVEADFPGLPAPVENAIDYVFRNGFTGTGDLPCRKAFLIELKGRPITPPDFWQRAGFYAPEANPKVEFNGFCYTPRHKRRWLRTTLTAPLAGSYRFKLSTCGGVRIWVSGKEAAAFEPFERNTEHGTEIVLPLAAGENDVLMHMEDIFERDTNWTVALQYLDDARLEIGIPTVTDPEIMAEVRALSAQVRPARDFFGDEPFVLVFDQPATRDIPVNVKLISHQHDRATLLDADTVLEPGNDRIDLGPARALREGYHRVVMTFTAGDVEITRMLDAAFLRETVAEIASDSEADRKREALAYAARHGDPRIGRVLAMFACDEIEPVAVRTILGDTLASIEAREDCSDFVMIPLLWVWGLHKDKIPPELRARTRRAILEWRYWIDEPGNDVMWFWSENHVLCFHVSQYLAGLLFPEDRFTCSGRTGSEQQALAAERLGLWFDSVEAHGFVEWNSAAYYPIDFIGIFGLYHWCEGELKSRCKSLLDRLFLMTGLHTLEGVPAGSQGRAYDKELRAGPLTELAPFCRVAFGTGWLNGGVAALPLCCLSDYSAPAQACRAALWNGMEGIEARYTQGHDHNGKLVLYKDSAAMLSSVVEHSPGARGHQQHIVDIRLSGHPMARLWVNHPGEADPWGVKRPSFWSGNGVLPLVNQHRDTALMLYDLGEMPEMDFVHAFAAHDGLDEVHLDGQWLFARSGDGYAAIWASTPLDAVTTGPTARREYRANGLRSAWLVRVGNGTGASGFDAFMEAMKAKPPTSQQDTTGIAFTHPDGTELALDWTSGFSVDGTPSPFDAMTTTPRIRWGTNDEVAAEKRRSGGA